MVPPVYAVNSTHPDKWQTDVYEPAVRIIDAVLRVCVISSIAQREIYLHYRFIY